MCGKIKITREDLTFSLGAFHFVCIKRRVAEMKINAASFKLGPNEVRYLINKNQGKKLESNRSSKNYYT